MSCASISIIIPTLNSATTLGECLDSIFIQEYPSEALEVLIVDGGSVDGTLAVAAEYAHKEGIPVRILKNHLRTGEAAKAVGVRAARHEFIAFIDSDNVLPDASWLRAMVAPFLDDSIIAAEPIRYLSRPQDHYLTRYFSMLGMNDPLCLFLGNYDRISVLRNTWTGLPVCSAQQLGFLKVTLVKGALPTIGANGFIIRSNIVTAGLQGDYLFDIDVLQGLIAAKGSVIIAKVDVGIVHVFTRSIRGFARKQQRRVRDYLYFRAKRMRSFSWNSISPLRYAWFIGACVLIVPLLVQAGIGYARTKDRAWFFHPFACWITLWQYGTGTLVSMLIKSGYSRAQWSQS